MTPWLARSGSRGAWCELELLLVADDRRPLAHLRHTAIYKVAVLR